MAEQQQQPPDSGITLRGALGALLDRSVAVAVLCLMLWLGYRYHMDVITKVAALYEKQQEYLRKEVNGKLDEIIRSLERK